MKKILRIADSLLFAGENCRRRTVIGLCGVSLVAGLISLGRSEDSPSATSTVSRESATATSGEAANQRLREGTVLVDQLGTFKITGDRAAFVTADGKHRYGGLENLNLERIVRTLADDADGAQWAVSGIITEFRGSNYLIIQRAVRRTKAISPSESESVAIPVETP